jgi:hypothetical protein
MAGHLRVPGRMVVRRVVAAMRAPTFLAGTQVDPFAADLHAFIALVLSGVLDCGDCLDVRAPLIRHGPPLLPEAERTADGDELADVVSRVIGDQQNGAEVRLVALARGNRRAQIVHIARQRLQLLP